MRRARWIISPKPESPKPVIYHCISRAVNRAFVFGEVEREKMRMFMRMYENFSGNRILSYCLMSNHFHLLIEITPMPEGGLTDAELIRRVRALGNEAQAALLAAELEEARKKVSLGEAGESLVAEIHSRFTYRMHNLSEFMKSFTQRYTQWHNRIHLRKGRLWEDRFKSVIVEDGVACKAIAAYIDLNPVRAGIVKDPAQYRWSSYGEAVGGGAKGNGKKARAGLVRAMRAHKGIGADAELWAHDVSREYRKILLAGAVEKQETQVGKSGEIEVKRTRKGMTEEDVQKEKERLEKKLEELPLGRMLRCRVRYFTDGAVIGSKTFVNEAFANARERFSERRKDGARTMRGNASEAKGLLWSIRDLRVGIDD